MPMEVENNNPDNQDTIELKQSIQKFFQNKPSQESTNLKCRLIGTKLDLYNDINLISVLDEFSQKYFIGNDPSVYDVLETLIIRSRPVHFPHSNQDQQQWVDLERETREVELLQWTKNKLSGTAYLTILQKMNDEVTKTAQSNMPSFSPTTINNIAGLFECSQFNTQTHLAPLIHTLTNHPIKAVDELYKQVIEKISTPEGKRVASNIFSHDIKDTMISNILTPLEAEFKKGFGTKADWDNKDKLSDLRGSIYHIAQTQVLLPLQE